jgi:FKBP-type peptidyl-prolyl cis-trans isomerase FkpA
LIRHVLSACAALAAVSAAASAAAQAEGSGPSQDAAWHNRQMLALAERQASDGWYYLPGGALWRRVEGDGTGARPTVDDTVTLHYVGTLVDGTEFDSSVRRGQPATFPLRGLIRAWQLAVPMMTVGDTIEIAVPADMAYGPVGRGPIPGNATLLFTIELLGIERQ